MVLLHLKLKDELHEELAIHFCFVKVIGFRVNLIEGESEVNKYTKRDILTNFARFN